MQEFSITLSLRPITDGPMRIEQLEYLTAVNRHGSLRRASQQLHVSQPAVSEAIRNLERELGVTLLDRHRSGARISRAGLDLLQPITDVLESLDRLRAAAGDELAGHRLLRIGTVSAATATLVLPAVRTLQAAHPSATVEIVSLQPESIHAGLGEGTLDIGLVNLLDGDDIPPTLEPVALLSGRPVVVLPGDHRLAGHAEISVDELRFERFVAMRAGYIMYRFAHRLFGTEPPVRWHSTDGADMGKLMVAEGIGIAMLPDYSVYGDPLERTGQIVARPIADDATVISLVALRRRQPRTPALVHQMLERLKEHADAARAC